MAFYLIQHSHGTACHSWSGKSQKKQGSLVQGKHTLWQFSGGQPEQLLETHFQNKVLRSWREGSTRAFLYRM